MEVQGKDILRTIQDDGWYVVRQKVVTNNTNILLNQVQLQLLAKIV